MQVGFPLVSGTPGADPKATGWGYRLERFLQEVRTVVETLPSRLRAKDVVPVDNDIGRSQVQFYLDEGANKLMVRVRYSDGTLRTGEVVLT